MSKTFFLLICLFSTLSGSSAVTYDHCWGRFGDNLINYLHAKWLSFQYGIPLLYKPFEYSSELNMHDKESSYEESVIRYKRKIYLNDGNPKPVLNKSIYICPYFPECDWEIANEKYFTFDVDWKNQEFRKIAREMIASKNELQLIYPPKEFVSIAMHIREGGGFDDEELKVLRPLKLPPISFYCESLKQVLQLFPNQTIYCFLFTDAIDPQMCLNKIVESFPEDASIVFNFRKSGNRYDENVLEDFFSLYNFDILIRPQSNFSIVPSLLHDYAVVCSPEEFSVQDRVVTINKINVNINKKRFEDCLIK